jgi:hypothetical protein
MTSVVNRAADRADMAALSAPAANDTVYLTEEGREGIFVWEAANHSSNVSSDPRQGIYVASASNSSGSGGAWVRQFEESLDAEWFGAKPDGATDSSDAFDGLLSHLQAHVIANPLQPTSPGGYRIRFGRGKYYFSRIHTIRVPTILEGAATAQGLGAPGTWLDFESGGFFVERHNTTGGNNTTLSPASTGGDGTTFRNLYMSSRQSRPADNLYEAQATDGIRAWCRIIVQDCTLRSFTRDGIHVDSNITNNANANCTIIERTNCQLNGRHGIMLNGVDANACNLRDCTVDFNNNWGIYDDTFLSNHHWGHHASFNGNPGVQSGHKGDAKTSVVVHPGTGGGTIYYINPGQAAAASTTVPGTNNAIWVKQGEGQGTVAGPNLLCPAWYSGIPTKEGGSYYIDGIQCGMAVNLYQEGSQGAPYSKTGNPCFFGGEFERNPNSLGTYVYGGENGYLRSTRGWGGQHIDPATGKETRVVLGRRLGSAPDEFFQFYNTDYFPGSGFMGTLWGGNLIFGTSQDYPHLGFIGPNSPFTWPSYTATKNTVWCQMIALGERPSGRLMTFGSAAPTSGSWDQGALVFNNAPSPGGKAGWLCTAGGTPGTWKAFGAIDA